MSLVKNLDLKENDLSVISMTVISKVINITSLFLLSSMGVVSTKNFLE
jgi:hypothetical protein